jgi:M6 family metalloprotease-like protein
MKKTVFLIATNLICLQLLFAQMMPDDFCSGPANSTLPQLLSTASSTNGVVHTPKGNLHILIVFIENQNDKPPSSYDGDLQNNPPGYWAPNDIPNWAKGTSNELLDATPATIGTTKNLSLFYKEMSDGEFILTGDIFPELIPVSGLNSLGGVANYAQVNAQAVAYINANYPNYNWSKYDNRTNSPNYNYDNSTSSPDNKLDYVVFMQRRVGFNGFAGIGSHTITTTFSGTLETFTINDGHTAERCFNSASHHWIFFKHEFAHNLYNAPHYLGANKCADGQYFYRPTGWGLMATWHQQFDVANAWEKWWLGWLTPQEVSSNGNYVLKDFITEHDAIRLPIPNAPGEYLWIENHYCSKQLTTDF